MPVAQRVAQAPPPGIVRNATPEATPNHWFDCSNIRFRAGQIEPVGGNVAVPNAVTPDLPRDILTWHDNSFVQWAAIGTDSKLFMFRFDTQVLYDITPTGVGSLEAPGAATGYGLGDYGEGTYGTARDPSDIGVTDISPSLGDMWSLATWGQDLLFVPTQDGQLYHWSPTTPGTAGAVVTGAPINNRGVIVTDQRSAVLLGAGGDPRNIAWSDQEDYTVWTPAVANLAGSKFLQTTSYVLNAIKVSAGVLIFTGNDVHLMTYVAPPYAYGIVQIAAGCGLASLRAAVAIGSSVMWPGRKTFWQWAGSVTPVLCDVGEWFYSLLSRDYIGRLFGSPNPTFAEMWWDWPDENNTECNRYIAVNYAGSMFNQLGAVVPNRAWTIGVRNRTAADPTGSMSYPILAGPATANWQPATAYTANDQIFSSGNLYTCATAGTSAVTGPGPSGTGTGIADGTAVWNYVSAAGGALYLHEYGWTENGVPRAAAGAVYAESGAITLGEGDQRFNVTQLVPNTASALPNMIGYSFTVREQPDDAASEYDTGTYTVISGGLMDMRWSGRTAQMRMEALQDNTFSIGRPRLLMKPGGKR